MELDHYCVIITKCSKDSTILKEYIEQDKVYDFVVGLNLENDQVRIQILGKEKVPRLNEVVAIIWSEESRRGLMLETSTTESSAMIAEGGTIMVANQRKNWVPSMEKKHEEVWCTHCNKLRHIREKCGKLHGKPLSTFHYSSFIPQYPNDEDGEQVEPQWRIRLQLQLLCWIRGFSRLNLSSLTKALQNLKEERDAALKQTRQLQQELSDSVLFDSLRRLQLMELSDLFSTLEASIGHLHVVRESDSSVDGTYSIPLLFEKVPEINQEESQWTDCETRNAINSIYQTLDKLDAYISLLVAYGQHHIRCLPKEREALLQFKAAIVDHNGMLSSWTTPDCCQWEGIRCTNLTAHIISLHLPGPYYYLDSGRYISGEIHKSLMELRHLQYFNLSFNDFRDTNIPEFLGSLTNLRYLDLSSCRFSGQIPTKISSLSHLKYLNLADNYYLNGSIPLQLGNLSRLQYLDLSWNYYLNGSIPREIGNLSRLEYLDLSGNSFEGSVPSQIGNLSLLQYLDLRYNSFEGYIPSQLGNLSNLHKLYLGEYHSALKIGATDQCLSNLNSLTHLSFYSISNFNSSPSCLRSIAKLPKLRELSLINCGLSDHFLLSFNPSNFNFSTSLFVFDLSRNSFTQPMVFQWVSNTTSNLVELDLSWNLLKGLTSNHFGLAMNSLEHLDLSYNVFKGKDLKSFMNICNLRSLDMSENNMTEDLSSILHNLSSGCVRYSLQQFSLAFNQIRGSVPDLSAFSNLKMLDLSENQLSGKIPEGTRLPSHLEQLLIKSNSLEGGVPKSFGNTCTLELLDLSFNKLSEDLTAIFNHLSGCSRYSLRELYLRQNKLNGTLPDFSMFARLEMLDLGFNQISGTLPNTLKLLPSLKKLYLDNNKLNGTISKDLRFPTDLEELSLKSNFLKGVLTDSHFYNMTKLERLILSDNSLTLEVSQNWGSTFQLDTIELRSCKLGPLFPKWLEKQNKFQDLDISNSGISDCWTHFKSLAYLNMSQNKFIGEIPSSMGSLLELQVLLLRNNNLSGKIPSILKNCTQLVMMDITENRLSGSIPNWIGNKLSQLQFLSLRSNYFRGSLPLQICYLKSIKLLDISQNNLSGEIPTCIKNFSSMAQSTSLRDYRGHQYSVNTTYAGGNYSYDLNAILMWKGSEQMFTDMGLSLLNSIDLSNNQLSGEIPKEIEGLFGLVSLNLSRNQLTGKIPSNVGELSSLEFLDLSQNQLVGSIPSSLAQIDRLTMLDLSHNYLSGKIPTGTQLQSFDPSKYEDNVDLCGPPLKKLCIDKVARQEPIIKFQEDDNLIFNLSSQKKLASFESSSPFNPKPNLGPWLLPINQPQQKKITVSRSRQGPRFHFGSEELENSKDRHSSCEETSKGRMRSREKGEEMKTRLKLNFEKSLREVNVGAPNSRRLQPSNLPNRRCFFTGSDVYLTPKAEPPTSKLLGFLYSINCNVVDVGPLKTPTSMDCLITYLRQLDVSLWQPDQPTQHDSYQIFDMRLALLDAKMEVGQLTGLVGAPSALQLAVLPFDHAQAPLGRHWQLLMISIPENTVVWFCSLHKSPPSPLKHVVDW
ncbi:hypothetical protein V8G54_011503 [Vigna mungo]|uniref:Leucine-rich repeat-containing N-terminal plant-type domain-containing protein n=1 Tax=Vigna mungo TaxID=3915 RepID=A0AAQ3S1B2_VIGMU